VLLLRVDAVDSLLVGLGLVTSLALILLSAALGLSFGTSLGISLSRGDLSARLSMGRRTSRNLSSRASLCKDVKLIIALRNLSRSNLVQLADGSRRVIRKAKNKALATTLCVASVLALVCSLSTGSSEGLDVAAGSCSRSSVASHTTSSHLAVCLSARLVVSRLSLGNLAARASLVEDVKLIVLLGDSRSLNAVKLAHRSAGIGRKAKEEALAGGVGRASFETGFSGGSAGLRDGLDVGVGGS
jgi:hypothetical protein